MPDASLERDRDDAEEVSQSTINPGHRVVVVGICLAVGGLHVVTGPSYGGPFPAFVNGYLIDILLPFAIVLLLGISGFAWAGRRTVRFVLVFGIGAATETLQYFGVPIFGQTFDLLDFAAFAVGAAAACGFERMFQRQATPGADIQ